MQFSVVQYSIYTYICSVNHQFLSLETEARDTEKRPFVTYDMLQSNFQKFFNEFKKEMIKTGPESEVLDVLREV